MSDSVLVTVTMPDALYDDLKQRARERGITVIELMRRAVALEKVLFEDPDSSVVLKKDGQEYRIVTEWA